MQTRSQAILTSIRKTTQNSNNFLPYLKAGKFDEFLTQQEKLDSIVFYTRAIADKVKKDPDIFAWIYRKHPSDNQQMWSLYMHLLVGILTDIYKVGRCQEFVSLGLLNFIKKGINKNIEIISFKGKLILNANPGDHVFLALDRDLNSNIQDPSTWTPFIKFDAWGESEVALHKEDKPASLNSLGVGVLNRITDVEQEFCWNRNFTRIDCEQFIDFLTLLKKRFTESLLLQAASVSGLRCREKRDFKQEVLAICRKLIDEITHFECLKKVPPQPPGAFQVKHWNSTVNYSPSLFNPNPIVIRAKEMPTIGSNQILLR